MEHKSYLPAGKNWKLVWNDEFDGDTLDTTKWGFRHHLFHHEFLPYTEEGVHLKDSCLYIDLVRKGDDFYSAHLQTGENYMDRPNPDNPNWPIAKFSEPKFLHKFGYYECRCKLPANNGWWAAFWLQSPIIGCSPDPKKAGIEIDIMESFENYGVISNKTMSCNAHWGGYNYGSGDYKTFGLHAYTLKPTEDDFHVYGMEWSLDGYKFYVDGEMYAEMKGPVSETEQFIALSTECNGYRGKEQGPCAELFKAELPDSFIVDYVRVFDEVK